MNKLGMREAMEMFEMLRDSACMIDHFTDYINHCQDQQLKSILERQQRQMVEEYHRKAGVIQQHGIDMTNAPGIQSISQGGATGGMTGMQGVTGTAGSQGTAGMAGARGMSGMAGMQGAYDMTGATGGTNIQSGVQQPASRTLSDRTIAQGALIFHKSGALRSTMAALESAEPHLRNLAANSARICNDMAYELFQYMQSKGMYPMPEEPKGFVNHMQHQAGQAYQGMMPGYHAGTYGTMGQFS